MLRWVSYSLYLSLTKARQKLSIIQIFSILPLNLEDLNDDKTRVNKCLGVLYLHSSFHLYARSQFKCMQNDFGH